MIETSLQILYKRLFKPVTWMRGLLNWFKIIGPWFFWLGMPFVYLGYLWVALVTGAFIIGVFMVTMVMFFRNNPDLERGLVTTRESVGAYLIYMCLVALSAVLAGSANMALLYVAGDLLVISTLRIKE